MPNRKLGALSLLVPDYQEAIEYYVSVLGFYLQEDVDLGNGKRWVVVSPDQQGSIGLLLARAVNERQTAAVGNQSGGRVFLFLETSDFDTDYSRLKARGVAFSEQPRDESYGKVVVFRDRFGNLWDLIQRAPTV